MPFGPEWYLLVPQMYPYCVREQTTDALLIELNKLVEDNKADGKIVVLISG